MSRMEELFMQIFDRKDRIVHQMKQQVQSYGESVAINFAAAGGGPPPPCLWNAGAGSDALARPLPQGFVGPVPSASGRPPVSPKFLFDQKSDFVSVGSHCQNVDVEPVIVVPTVEQNLGAGVRQYGNEVRSLEHLVSENVVMECCPSKIGNTGRMTRSRASSAKLDFEKGPLNTSDCIGRVRRSRNSSAQLDIEKQSLGPSDCACRVTRSRTSSPKLDFEKQWLDPSGCAGWVSRSRTSSAKLEFENRSLNVKNLAVFTVEYGHAVDKSGSIKNFLTKEAITGVGNADKVSTGGNENSGQNRILQDLSNKVLLENKHIASKKAVTEHFPSKDGNCTNYTGRVTRSRTSSAKLDSEKQSINAKNTVVFPAEYDHAVDKSRSSENFLMEEAIDGIENASGGGNENACYNSLFQDVSSKIPLEIEHTYMHSCTQEANESIVQATDTDHSKGFGLPSSGNYRKGVTAVDIESSVIESVSQQQRTAGASPIQNVVSEAKFSLRSSTTHFARSAKSISDCSGMISSGINAMPLDAQELEISVGARVGMEESSIEQTVVPGGHCSPSELDQCITRGSTRNGNKVSPVSSCSRRGELLFREHMICNDSHNSSEEHVPQKTITENGADVDNLPAEGRYFLRSSTSNDKAASVKSYRSGDTNCYSKRKAIPHACDLTWPKRKKMDCPVEDIFGTSQRLRLDSLRHANQCRPKRSSVYTSEPIVDSHHLDVSKEATHEMVNAAPLSPSEDMQLEVVHHMEGKVENGATDITSTVSDLENNYSSYHDVGFFLMHTSEPVYSNFSGSLKGKLENRRSSNGVNFSSHIGDGSTVIETVPHMEVKEEEAVTDIIGVVPELINHHTSDDGVDLFCRHTPQHENSGCSLHLVGPMQNRRSCDEVDFFSHVGDAAAIIEAIPHVEGKEENEITGDTILELRNHHISDHSTDILHEGAIENGNSVYLGHSEGAVENRITCSEVNFSSNDSVKSLLQEKVDLGVSVQMSPEIEGFSIGAPSEIVDCNIIQNSYFPTSALDNASLTEKLHTSTGVMTPLHCSSSKHKIHRVPDISHSLPDSLSSHFNFTNSLSFNRDDIKQLWASECGKTVDAYECTVRDGSVLGASNSQPVFSTGFLFESDARRPFTPPVEKYYHQTNSNRSGSSSGQLVNPELICFRIDENASITGEDEILDELEETAQQRVSSSEIIVSTDRKTPTDMTLLYQNAPTMVSTSQKCLDRGSLDSVNTEAYMEPHMNDSQHTLNGNRSSMRSNIKRNKNQSLSANTKKAVGSNSLQNRSGKPKLSLRVRNQHKRQVSAGKGCRPTNIVANVSSFIPLVQQKQQAAAILNGKRDIKVKALEAAEAAKRQIEKKEKERKMKKEAARVERMRLEQEKLKHTEVERKKKEEEKRKKEAQIEARKRQREDDEKKEKQRKRRCIEETLRQHKEQDRIHAEDKQLRSKAAEHKKAELAEDSRKHQSSSNILESAEGNKLIEVDQSISVKYSQEVGDTFKDKNANGKMSNSSIMDEKACNRLTRKESCESQSYEISPYRDSDGEDEDNIPRRKPIPLWARRESLDHLLRSQRHMDTGKIFCCRRSFSLNKVLSARIRPRPFAQR